MRIKILKDIYRFKRCYKAGTIITVADDGNGVPLDIFWRNRVKDSPIDDCVKIININKKVGNDDNK